MTESPAEKGKRVLEGIERRDAEIAKKFNPDELIKEASKPRVLVDEELGEIHYVLLTTKDLFELNGIENKQERAVQMIFRMLKPCYPTLTLEKIEQLPSDVTTRLATVLSGNMDFLQKQKPLTDGSKPTEKRNELAS
jgi:hypothetical protein